MVKFYHPKSQPKEFDWDAFVNAPSSGGRHSRQYDVRSNDTGELVGWGFASLEAAYNFANDPTENPKQSASNYLYEEAYTKLPDGHIFDDNFGHISSSDRPYSLRDVVANGAVVARDLSLEAANALVQKLNDEHFASLAATVASYDDFVTLRTLIHERAPGTTPDVATVQLIDPATGKRNPIAKATHTVGCLCEKCINHNSKMRDAQRRAMKRSMHVVDERHLNQPPSVMPMPFPHDYGTSGRAQPTRTINGEVVPGFSAALSAEYIPAQLNSALALIKVNGPEIVLVEIGYKNQIIRTLRKMTPRVQMRYRLIKYKDLESVRALATHAVVTKSTGRIIYRGSMDNIRQWAGEKVRKYDFDLNTVAIINIVPFDVTRAMKKAG